MIMNCGFAFEPEVDKKPCTDHVSIYLVSNTCGEIVAACNNCYEYVKNFRYFKEKNGNISEVFWRLATLEESVVYDIHES
jgi:hypothetical protein